MARYGDFELEIKKAGKTLGELIEKNAPEIGYKESVGIALEAMMKEIHLGKQRRAEILSIEAIRLVEKEKRPIFQSKVSDKL